MIDKEQVMSFLLKVHNHEFINDEQNLDCINMKRICRAYLKCINECGVDNKINMRSLMHKRNEVGYKEKYIETNYKLQSIVMCMEIWNRSAKWHLGFKDLTPEEITRHDCMKRFTEYVLSIVNM